MERPQKVGIIIPAYNEAATVASVIEAVIPFGLPIVIDDFSTDDTAEIAQSTGAIVVSHHYNRGYDAALNTGFAQASKLGCAYAVTFDADGQHHSEYIVKVVEQLENGYDLVLTVRPSFPRFAEYLFSCYTRLRFGVFDPLSGLKGYRLGLYHELGHFDSYGSIGTELLLFGVKQGKSFTQISIPISERHDAPRFGQSWRANLKILRAMGLSFRPKT